MRRTWSLGALALLGLVLFAGCRYRPPDVKTCRVLCSSNGECPAESSCHPDGFCHRRGDDMVCSRGDTGRGDASFPDAQVLEVGGAIDTQAAVDTASVDLGVDGQPADAAAPDVAKEAAVDVSPDLSPDLSRDVSLDLAADTRPDLAPEAAAPDVAPEAAVDLARETASD